MPQFSKGGVNVNFLTGEEGEERVHAAYGAANYKRLVELKNKYDPQNIFRLNQNIPPNLWPGSRTNSCTQQLHSYIVLAMLPASEFFVQCGFVIKFKIHSKNFGIAYEMRNNFNGVQKIRWRHDIHTLNTCQNLKIYVCNTGSDTYQN